MIKNFILFLLLANTSFIISLKSGQIVFDEEIDFDETNSEFNFDNEGEETEYYLMTISPTESVKLKYTCGDRGFNGNIPERMSIGLKLDKTQSCNIILSADGGNEFKGKIMVHPLKNEIPVDLTKITEHKGFGQAYETFPPLVYSVSNVTENVKFKFDFVNVKIPIGDKTFTLSNPFQVCGEKCENDVKTYKFAKGKEYKIKIKFQELKTDSTTRYYFPDYSFEKTSKSENIKIALSLISLLLLLLC